MSILERRIANVNTFQTWSPQWQEIFVNQYDQGKVKLQQRDSGDGLDLLESPMLPLMSPMLATMRCTLIYDTKNPRAGGFQLRVEENSRPITQFTVPFTNIGTTPFEILAMGIDKSQSMFFLSQMSFKKKDRPLSSYRRDIAMHPQWNGICFSQLCLAFSTKMWFKDLVWKRIKLPCPAPFLMCLKGYATTLSWILTKSFQNPTTGTTLRPP